RAYTGTLPVRIPVAAGALHPASFARRRGVLFVPIRMLLDGVAEPFRPIQLSQRAMNTTRGEPPPGVNGSRRTPERTPLGPTPEVIDRARTMLRMGVLPSVRFCHVLGGYGTSCNCSLCLKRIDAEQLRYELRRGSGELIS